MRRRLLEFVREEEGIDAIEYGILVALIFIVILAAVTLFAANATALFTKVATNM